MKKHLLLTLPLLLVVPVLSQPVAESPSWLDSKGILTVQELVDSLGAQPTPDQKSEVEKALAKRNEAVKNANAALSSTLKKALAIDDNKVATETKENKRLERIRKFQPARYNEMMKQAEKDKAAQGKVEEKPKTP